MGLIIGHDPTVTPRTMPEAGVQKHDVVRSPNRRQYGWYQPEIADFSPRFWASEKSTGARFQSVSEPFH